VLRTLKVVAVLILAWDGAAAAAAAQVVSGERRTVDLLDVDVSLSWTRDWTTASIKREAQGQNTGGRIAVGRELVYRHTRDALNLGAAVGVWRDLRLFLNAPLVIADTRGLDFDGACAGGTVPNCVDENNATILRDGLLPGFRTPSFGRDSEHGRPFQRPAEQVFAGPRRRGLESLGVGVSWAVLNQARDDVRPTWVVSLESRFAVGEEMSFDPQRPTANRAVGLGYHQLVLATVFSRRFRVLEPYIGGWYLFPIATSNGVYQRAGLGVEAFSRPQQRGGTEVGLQAVAWEDARAHQRIGFELRGRLELRMFGLARGPLWEPLSGAASCPRDPTTCRGEVDRDSGGDGAPDANPGITRSPAYGLFGADAGLNVQVGRLIRFRGLFGVSFEEGRFLTDGRSGYDVYDLPGRRFRVEDTRTWHLMVDGGLAF
jgi:hypothetical protein